MLYRLRRLCLAVLSHTLRNTVECWNLTKVSDTGTIKAEVPRRSTSSRNFRLPGDERVHSDFLLFENEPQDPVAGCGPVVSLLEFPLFCPRLLKPL